MNSLLQTITCFLINQCFRIHIKDDNYKDNDIALKIVLNIKE